MEGTQLEAILICNEGIHSRLETVMVGESYKLEIYNVYAKVIVLFWGWGVLNSNL